MSVGIAIYDTVIDRKLWNGCPTGPTGAFETKESSLKPDHQETITPPKCLEGILYPVKFIKYTIK